MDTGFEDIHITNHVKRLPVAYVYATMANFGAEFRKIVAPFYKLVPQAARNVELPFYIGEMIVTARKSSAQG